MESKYYTPAIEEFHVGFEYEVFDNRYEYKVEKISETKLRVLSDPVVATVWFKEVYGIDSLLYIEDSSDIRSNLSSYIENNNIRVKYLDKEDIESLGFIKVKDYSSSCTLQLTNNDCDLIAEIDLDDDCNCEIEKFDVCGVEPNGFKDYCSSVVFKGVIKNKSELVKLLKQLDIHE